MEYAAVHRDQCLAAFATISALFGQFANNPDLLLAALDALPDVGLVIASGLIFAANRETFVPFDKYTMGWSLQLGILPDNKISKGDYAKYSAMVVEHTKKKKLTILDFVLEADVNAKFPFEPE